LTLLPTPTTGREAAERFVAGHLGHLISDEPSGSLRFRGGQSAADDALDRFDVTGYERHRNEVFPTPQRGASGLSPYIRHGLLTLDRVWRHVDGGPRRDVAKFRSELLWQEYARHWYARLGSRTANGLRATLDGQWAEPNGEVYDRDMACVDLTLGELEDDGWLVNQSRMWLASQWAVRQGFDWRAGEEFFFRHLLDGSRAANRLGWQWTAGVASTKVYSFNRWQVEERAKGLCASCDLVHACPIESWPDSVSPVEITEPSRLRGGDDQAVSGPTHPWIDGVADRVWLTAESLGHADPALLAHPDLPAVFVFDEPLLARLQLSGKRLVFLAETLAELATARPVELRLGDPTIELADAAVAVTHAPVPGFASRAAAVRPVAIHPYPWLHRPVGGSIRSFSAWLRVIDELDAPG
jgi:deoxyribodipyrimidine photo-lyase